MQAEQIVMQTVAGLSAELGAGGGSRLSLSSHLEADLGIGSLERVELIRRLEHAVGGSLPEQELFEADRVMDLVAVVASGRASPEQRPRSRTNGPFAPAPAPPEGAGTLVDVLSAQAEALGEQPRVLFLKDGEVAARLSPLGVLNRARRVATGLHVRGVGVGDRVAVMVPTGPDFFAAFFGAIWAGGVPVPLYPPFRLDQAEDYVKRQGAILRNCGARVMALFPEIRRLAEVLRPQAPELEHLVTLEELERETPALARVASPEELALVQYTSGSTGVPRGVALSHRNLLANIRAIAEGMEMHSGDVVVSWLPLYHDMGLIGKVLCTLYRGLPLVLMGPEQFLARPSRWLRALSDYSGTISCAPNFAYEICAEKIAAEELDGLDLSHWRIALNGAEPVRAETIEKFVARFGPLGFGRGTMFPAYGLAEATLAVTFPPPGRPLRVDAVSREQLELADRAVPGDDLRLVSCGRVLRGLEVRVADVQGRALPERRQGRVLIRGNSVMEGYFANPAATRAVLDGEGWLDTGDLGYLAEGELYLTGRAKDLIIKAGRNLHPNDIEALLDDIPGLRPGCSAAFAVAREGATEQLVVVAETRAGTRSEVLQRQVAAAVTHGVGITPDRIELVPPRSVPKTPSGKVRRSECRALFLEGSLGRSRPLAVQLGRVVATGGGYWLRRGLVSALDSLRTARACAAMGVCSTPVLATILLRPGLTPAALRWCSRVFLALCGLRYATLGSPPRRGPLVLAANHASLLDPLVMLAAWEGDPLRFVISRTVAEHPFANVFISRTQHIVVSRGRDGAPLAVQAMEAALREGACVLVFPEGGIEAAPGLRTFATGAFRAAVAAGAPVLPVTLQGTRQALPPGNWAVRSGGHVTVDYGPPLPATGEGWDGAVELARQARQTIASRSPEPLLDRRMARRD